MATKKKTNKAKFLNDASFVRTRENVSEFKEAMRIGKLIRNAFRAHIKATSSGSELVGRMQQTLMLVLKTDTTSDRGARQISKGELGLLNKFDFNAKAFLEAVLFAKYTTTADRASGKLTVQFPAFIPAVSLTTPIGATHFRIVTAAAEFDFTKEDYIGNEVLSELIPYNNVETAAINLEVSITAASKQAFLHLMGVQYYQEVNGKMYLLKDDAHSALRVIHAESAVA